MAESTSASTATGTTVNGVHPDEKSMELEEEVVDAKFDEGLKHEEPPATPHENGFPKDDPNGDGGMVMEDPTVPLADTSSNASMASLRRSSDAMEEDMPPAKRARMHSDADQASLNHVSSAFNISCAADGVLTMPRVPSEVCCPRSADSYPPVLRWHVDFGLISVQVLHFHHPQLEEAEGCWSFLPPCRPRCPQHSSLPVDCQEPDGL